MNDAMRTHAAEYIDKQLALMNTTVPDAVRDDLIAKAMRPALILSKEAERA